MKGFVEIFCEHAGLIRVGPQCDSYGSPYDFACAFKIEGNAAILKGLVSRDIKPTRAHFRAAEEVLAAMGLVPVWERRKS